MRENAKNLVAVLAGVLLVAALEAVLALAGLTPLFEEDPYVGFEGSLPLFVGEPDGDGIRYTLNPAKLDYFNPQVFRMPKAPGTFRIVSFGGSTTYGNPYLMDTAFPAWLAAALGRCDDGHRYESINAGGISYASYRVRRLVEELAAFSPDLYVVYSGHNEFLESRTFEEILTEDRRLRSVRAVLNRSRIFTLLYHGAESVRRALRRSGSDRLPGEVRAILEQPGGPGLYHRDEAFRDGVIRQYRHNIEAIVRVCRRRSIPLVLCTLPSNLSGVSPFKSEHRAGLAPADLTAWEDAFGAALEALRTGEPGRALVLLEKAERIDATFALLQFVKGNALAELGRLAEARAAFVRAKEEDIIPLRALEIFNEILRDVARRERVPLADVAASFADASPEGITGPSLFVDHVHPTIQAHQRIALLVADAALAAGAVPSPSRRGEACREAVSADFSARLARVSQRYYTMGLWSVGRVYYWAGKHPEAYVALREAWRTVRDVPEIPYLLGSLELERGDPSAAAGYLREAVRLDPANQEALVALATAAIALGDGATARLALEQVPDDGRRSPAYVVSRGRVALLLGNIRAAQLDLEEGLRLAPGVPATVYSLARASLLAGRRAEARGLFAQFLELDGEPWSDVAFERFQEDRSIVPPPRPTAALSWGRHR